MFEFLKRPERPLTPLESVEHALEELGYELNETGLAAARIQLDAGQGAVAIAARLAVISMAHALKHAGVAATGVLRFRPQAADLLERITAFREEGRLDAGTWQQLHDAVIGISAVNDQQEAWLDKVLQDPAAQSGSPARHK